MHPTANEAATPAAMPPGQPNIGSRANGCSIASSERPMSSASISARSGKKIEGDYYFGRPQEGPGATRPRHCRKCLVLKGVEDFPYVKKGNAYARVCADCQNKQGRERRRLWRLNNPSTYRGSERAWASDKCRLIIECIDEGKSLIETIRITGLTLRQLTVFRNYRNIPMPEHWDGRKLNSGGKITVWTFDRLEEVRCLVHQRVSMGRIAARLKISRNKVSGVIWRYRLRTLYKTPDRFISRNMKNRIALADTATSA